VLKNLLGEDSVKGAKLANGRKVIVLEDTWISMCSPVTAGIPTLAVPNEWSVHQNFSAAISRVDELTDLMKGDVEKPLGDRLVANLSELAASVAPMEAIIIGSIGVLAHCCEIQWKTFNQALAEMYENGELTLVSGKKMEKKVFWEKEQYIESLTSTGGPNRLKVFFQKCGIWRSLR
jgi:hypothetical protein